jgi:hypothetical protein
VTSINSSLENYSSKLIQHLGIVAGVCKEIRLAELIDRHVENGERKVTIGEAVVAMVLNAMGFYEYGITELFFRLLHRYWRIRGLIPDLLTSTRLLSVFTASITVMSKS